MATETGDSGAETGEQTPEADDSAATSSVSDTETSVDTDDDSGYEQFERSLIVTTCATLMGIVAGVISGLYVGDPESRLGLIILLAAVIVQLPFYNLIGMDTDDFGAKGNIYIAFMTFVLWFISWTIILTTEAL